MLRSIRWLLPGWIACLAPCLFQPALAAPLLPTIAVPADASSLELYAAREVRRYLYLRTGRLLTIDPASSPTIGVAGAVVVARKARPVFQAMLRDQNLRTLAANLTAQEFWLKTVSYKGRRVVLLAGGDDLGVLYAAYRFAEHFGARFYLHGDVLPDNPAPLRLPVLDERSQPIFALRGIQPFHDFPEGPDWWNLEDYQGVIGQLPKLRMNFLGLHTYPENAPNAEPTVWIGPAAEAGAGGQVEASYASSYQNTLRGNWGYASRKTGGFHFGAAQLFEEDAYGADTMLGSCPQPSQPDGENALFNQTAAMLKGAFEWAHRLGVKTCVGTETPLTVPKKLEARLKGRGIDPASPGGLQSLYEGIFHRIASAYPIDYYWLWTPEGWTWDGTKDAQVKRTLDDIAVAVRAAKAVAAPFQLATCGWVLGPQHDRALFDKVLPKEMAVSCINREVGKTPVDRGFAEVRGRGKWAIPWLEDDPALTSPQLWAGRMRRDAADARRYGCDGLMGIHWRTRVLAPGVAALAQAAWDQSSWNADPFSLAPTPWPNHPGPVGGTAAGFPSNVIEGTDEGPVYQSVRYNLSAYSLALPNGSYAVTLKFCEPHYAAAGKRVFGVKLQGKPVIQGLDIFAKVGQNHPLDFTYEHVVVSNGWLNLEFVPEVEFPSIAGLVVQGAGFTRKINCGGPAYKDYEADAPSTPTGSMVFPSTVDFYQDWASHEFGLAAGRAAAAIFARVDGHLPRPSDWVDGPGGLRPDLRPWVEAAKDYAFVDEVLALRPVVRGAGNLARFDYWAETFQYLRAMGQVDCAWGAYNAELPKVKAIIDEAPRRRAAREQLLPLRRRLIQALAEVYTHLLAFVSNPGELGTVANWEQHIIPGVVEVPGEELAKMLGSPLPDDAQLASCYRGPARLILPTYRGSFSPGERLRLKVILLSEQPPKSVVLRWRDLGMGRFRSVEARHSARGVYSVELPGEASALEGIEYYAAATFEKGARVTYPATAPGLNLTMVALPPGVPATAKP